MRKKLEITERELGKFVGYLRREEREDSTIESYMRTALRALHMGQSLANHGKTTIVVLAAVHSGLISSQTKTEKKR